MVRQVSAQKKLLHSALPVCLGTAVLAGLYATSLYSYLLFHSLIEMFSVFVAFVIFVLAWHTRHLQDNRYLLFIGISLLFTGVVELLHTFAYKGMGIFTGFTADQPTQLWITFRYLFSISLLLAPVFLKRTVNAGKTMAVYFGVTVVLLYTVFTGRFPACFVEGVGLTPFKIYSEYVISGIFLAALGLLIANQASVDRTVLRLMVLSIVASIASEVSFTQYVSVFGSANMMGHFFLLASMLSIYRAIVITGVVDPSSLLFRNLKRSEEAIRESEERYRALVELSPDAVTLHSDGVWQYVNPAGLRLFGASSRAEIVGTRVVDRVHPDCRALVTERIHQVEGEAGRAEFRELTMLRIDGTAVEVESTAARSFYRGSPAVQVIMRDIADRKKAERAVEKSRAELSAMIENVPIVTLLLDRERRVRKANVAAQIFAGRPEADMVGLRGGEALRCIRSLDDPRGCGFGPSCGKCPVRKTVQDVFEQGGRQQGIEADLSITRGGKLQEVTVVLSTLPVSIGDEQLTLVCIEDITERKKAEGEIRKLNSELKKHVLGLETANRELESFAYSVSHDLKAPLRSINGFSRALAEDYGKILDDTGKDNLNRVLAATGKMGQLIDALLNLSRLTRVNLNPGPVDLSTLARAVADDLRTAEPGRVTEFIIADGVTAEGDAVMLRAAVENLVSNAWKFTSKQDRARIEFGIRQKDGENVYFVRDNGAGFDMAYGAKLFTAFQRLHTAEEFPGIGIGLATVQRIVHRHGGRIWAEGETGKGATFYFTL
jgi:PAS domain S-box-containing protein